MGWLREEKGESDVTFNSFFQEKIGPDLKSLLFAIRFQVSGDGESRKSQNEG